MFLMVIVEEENSLSQVQTELSGDADEDEIEEMAERHEELERDDIESLREAGEINPLFLTEEERLAEDGLARNDIEITEPERAVEELLIEDDNIGYNPDEDDFDIYGNLTITEAEDIMHIKYTLADLSNGENGKPFFMEVPGELMERAIQSFVKSGDINVEVAKVDAEGYLDIAFSYQKDVLEINTEYLAEAISDFEEEANLEDYSGR